MTPKDMAAQLARLRKLRNIQAIVMHDHALRNRTARYTGHKNGRNQNERQP